MQSGRRSISGYQPDNFGRIVVISRAWHPFRFAASPACGTRVRSIKAVLSARAWTDITLDILRFQRCICTCPRRPLLSGSARTPACAGSDWARRFRLLSVRAEGEVGIACRALLHGTALDQARPAYRGVRCEGCQTVRDALLILSCGCRESTQWRNSWI